jgi:hypothetical protein
MFVGMARFELATSSSRTKRATGLRYIPFNFVWACKSNIFSFVLKKKFDDSFLSDKRYCIKKFGGVQENSSGADHYIFRGGCGFSRNFGLPSRQRPSNKGGLFLLWAGFYTFFKVRSTAAIMWAQQIILKGVSVSIMPDRQNPPGLVFRGRGSICMSSKILWQD